MSIGELPELPIINKPVMQAGLAAANIVGATLLFRDSKGEKPFYGLVAGVLLLFSSYHIWKAIDLWRKEEV